LQDVGAFHKKPDSARSWGSYNHVAGQVADFPPKRSTNVKDTDENAGAKRGMGISYGHAVMAAQTTVGLIFRLLFFRPAQTVRVRSVRVFSF